MRYEGVGKMGDKVTRMPSKLLVIESLTFILPEDFKGDFNSALECLIEYVNNSVKKETDPEEDTTRILLKIITMKAYLAIFLLNMDYLREK